MDEIDKSKMESSKEKQATTAAKIQEKIELVDKLNDSGSRIQFEELANNCSQRINELNNMILRVREEKQRLRENTYSSISIPSPEQPSQTPKVSSKSLEDEEEESNSISIHALPDRHAAITGSHDSGIGQSRPATRQEALGEDHESMSCSIETAKTSISIARHTKPPPVLKRFSPQLDEELAVHELSTIIEVDTPITSRVQTARSESETAFEQYVQENKLPTEVNEQLANEFSDVMSFLQKRDNVGSLKYTDFPSMLSYLKQISHGGEIKETSLTFCENSQRIDDNLIEQLINRLRLASLSIRTFPPAREYIQDLHQNSNVEMLDTESIENISEDGTAESDSDTMNIEEELRKRKLLPKPFRIQKIHTNIDKKLNADESGSSKLSQKEGKIVQKSQYNFGTGGWADSMIRRMQETNALSSGTSPTPEKKTKTASKIAIDKNYMNSQAESSAPSVGDDTMGSLDGRELNLRDFLQREFSRYCNSTSGSTSSPSPTLDYSLRHKFFNSILDSMTPKTQASSGKGAAAPPTSKNTEPSTIQGFSSSLSDHLADNATMFGTTSHLARQKTSTPVQTSKSQTQDNSSSATSTLSSLFSCESRISSVAAIKSNKYLQSKHKEH